MKIKRALRPELIASKDITRENLAEPYVDATAKLIVSTNGHCLVALPVEIEEGDVSGQVSASALKAARKARVESIALTGKAELVVTGESFPRKPVTFPHYNAVIPTFRDGDKGTVSIQFSATYLKNISDAMGADTVVITFDTRDDESAIVVTCGPEETCGIAVLMPVRRCE